MSEKFYPVREEDGGGVLPLVEATKGTHIRVTRRDIQQGVPEDAYSCALAQGARRLPNVQWARFETTVAYLGYANKVIRYLIPEATSVAIREFDAFEGQFGRIGVFELLAVPERRRLDHRRGLQRAQREGGVETPRGGNPNLGRRNKPVEWARNGRVRMVNAPA